MRGSLSAARHSSCIILASQGLRGSPEGDDMIDVFLCRARTQRTRSQAFHSLAQRSRRGRAGELSVLSFPRRHRSSQHRDRAGRDVSHALPRGLRARVRSNGHQPRTGRCECDTSGWPSGERDADRAAAPELHWPVDRGQFVSVCVRKS